jgi:hypothetical protein
VPGRRKGGRQIPDTKHENTRRHSMGWETRGDKEKTKRSQGTVVCHISRHDDDDFWEDSEKKEIEETNAEGVILKGIMDDD